MDARLTIPPDDFSTDALEEAVVAFIEVIGDHDDVRLCVTTDFVEAVRTAIVDDPEYAAAYEQARELAFAVAKTITQADGSTDLIVDAQLFALTADPAAAARTLEHEGLHIVISRRGESLNDLRLRRGQPHGSATGTVMAIAGIACEEFRVERTMWDLHPDGRGTSQISAFGSTLETFKVNRPGEVGGLIS